MLKGLAYISLVTNAKEGILQYRVAIGKCALMVVGSHKNALFDLIPLSFWAAWNIWGGGPVSFIHILR